MEFIQGYESDTVDFSTSIKSSNIYHHNAPRIITVFDVETTGLIPKKDSIQKDIPLLNQMPYILQFSFIQYDIIERSIIKIFNSYINIDYNIKIEPIITELTGITREKCNSGTSITRALKSFYKAYMSSDYVIAHNIKFDSEVVQFEIERNFNTLIKSCPHILSLFDSRFNRLMNIYNYCTMQESVHICNIMIPTKTDSNKKYKKFPQLKELYFTLFHRHPENLHNSIVDVLYTLRCFLRIKIHQEIHDEKFEHFMRNVL